MLEKFDWKKIARVLFFIALFSLGGCMILMSHLDKMRLQEKKVDYKTEISETRKGNEALKKEKIELEKEDSEATKRLLRKEGLVKEGEKIIKFSNDEAR